MSLAAHRTAQAAFHPQVRVPGATRVYVDGDPLKPEYDKKGRPVWDMPRPVAFATHYRSAGRRRRFEQQKADIEAKYNAGGLNKKEATSLINLAFNTATKQVPIYRGMPANIAQKLRYEARRKARSLGVLGRGNAHAV